MAINIPIVTEFVDQGLKSAQGAFANFRTQVGQAEGAMGKLKAGGTAAFDSIKANAGAMALGAGTAIAGFAMKAIGDFQNLALEVDKFSNVTRIAAEESSRWIEVAGSDTRRVFGLRLELPNGGARTAANDRPLTGSRKMTRGGGALWRTRQPGHGQYGLVAERFAGADRVRGATV